MEGIYALHFLFKPNYFGNFAQINNNRKKDRNVIESIANSFHRNLLFAGHQKYPNKIELLLMLKNK